MGSNKIARRVRLVSIAAVAAACTSLQAAPPIHVIEHGDAVDPTVAYVIFLPHVRVEGERFEKFRGVVVGKTVEGSAREYSVELASDRPTLVRMAPGRYHFAQLEIGDYAIQVEEEQSLFDAKAGQLNYPGDWDVGVVQHDLTRGARKYGWRLEATITPHEEAVDLGKLDVDAGFVTAMKPVYTHVEAPAPRAAGGG